MGLLTGLAFWIMCGIIWLFATPMIMEVIASSGISGMELFLMYCLPWAVLLSIIARIIYVLRSGGETA
jgi:hypothetical protein